MVSICGPYSTFYSTLAGEGSVREVCCLLSLRHGHVVGCGDGGHVPAIHLDVGWRSAQQRPRIGRADVALLSGHELEIVVAPVDGRDIRAVLVLDDREVHEESEIGRR